MSEGTTDVGYLVAWGGDKRSADALKLGAVLATTFGAHLDVVYALHEESPFTVQHAGERNFQDHVAEQAKATLTAAVAELPQGLDVRLYVRRSHSIAGVILETAKELGSACIVMGAGTSGRSMTAHPVASALLHASSVPVAMAPRGYRTRQVEPLEELVAATGFRPGAQLVIDEAVEAASRVQLPLRLISLVEVDKADDVQAEAARAATVQALEDAAQPARGRCDVTVTVGHGKNLKQAVKGIPWNPHSAILVGSSRLAQGRQTFLGTIATRMLAHLDIPMIVVPRND